MDGTVGNSTTTRTRPKLMTEIDRERHPLKAAGKRGREEGEWRAEACFVIFTYSLTVIVLRFRSVQ